jgi:hypothetical protein
VQDELEQYPEKQKRGPGKTQLNYDKYIRALDALDDGEINVNELDDYIKQLSSKGYVDKDKL